MSYRATVSDEMTFDKMLASLSPLDREAVDRVLTTGGFRSRITQDEVRDARESGYRAGYQAASKAVAPAA